jgi:hypothetical protein
LVSPVQFARFHGRNYLNASSGAQIGYAAAWNCEKLGLPEGTTVWVDAEWTDNPGDAAVLSYLRAWGKAVAEAGYRPGVYVGYDGLTGSQWYGLPYFRAYWASAMRYIGYPEPRGFCMYQGLEHSAANANRGRAPIYGVSLDQDFARYDQRGERAWMVSA